MPAPGSARFAAHWQRWAAVGAAALVLVILFFSTRSGSHTPLPPSADPASADLADPPREITANPPPNLDGKSARDWNRIIDELRRGRFSGARHRLDDFERKWGTTAETQSLRDQIESLPDQDEGPRRKHGD